MQKNKFPYLHSRVIPFGDTDAAAIVYTPNFSNYCMEAAEIFFRQYVDVDWYRLNTELNRGTPVVHMALDFKAALKGGDELNVCVLVEKMGNSTVSLLLKGYNNTSEVECFTATFVFCFTEKGRSIPLSDLQRSCLSEYKSQCELVQNLK